MSLTGKRYTDDFKTQMIELYNSGQSVIKLSREYGIRNIIKIKMY
jgi:transposase-like protein